MAADAVSLLFKLKAEGGREAAAEVGKLRSAVTSEIKGIGDSFTSALGPVSRFTSALGPVGAGLGAAAGLALTAAGAVFKLAQNAAEAGARFHDLSVQSGISVETLSGLDLATQQAGTSIEVLTNGSFLLTKNLAAAAEGNKELQKTFAALGIKDVRAAMQDTEGTLKTVINSLARMTSEGERNAAGAKVMGRAYKDLAVFVADTGGDIDSLIDKARRAGLVMSRDAAEAADRFGDSMDEARKRLSAFIVTAGTDVMKEMARDLESLNEGLEENAQNTRGAQDAVLGFYRALKLNLVGVVALMKTLTDPAELARVATQPIETLAAAVKRGRDILFRELEGRTPDIAFGAETEQAGVRVGMNVGKKTGGGDDDLFDDDAAAKKRADDARKAREASQRAHLDLLKTHLAKEGRLYAENVDLVKDSLKRNAINVEDYVRVRKELEEKRLKDALAANEREWRLGDAQALTAEQRSARAADLREKDNAARASAEAEGREIEREAAEYRKRQQEEELRNVGDYYDRRLEKAEQAGALELRRLQLNADLALGTFEAAARQQNIIEAKRLSDRLDALMQEEKAVKGRAAEEARVAHELGLLAIERERFELEKSERLREAHEKDNEVLREKVSIYAELRAQITAMADATANFGAGGLGAAAGGGLGASPFPGLIQEESPFGALKAHIEDLGQTGKFWGEVLTSSFNAFADAVGESVKNFVLFGTIKGGFKAFAAELIASLAQMAAVQAVWELAQGLAALALSWFFPGKAFEAAGHFAASAVYASIAGIASVAGRAVAGDTFTQGGGVAGNAFAAQPTGGTLSGQSGAAGGNGNGVIEASRNREPQRIILEVRSNDSHIIEVAQRDVRSSGVLRELIVEVAGA